jgi:phosphate transport system substrate-binding protein
MKKEVVLISLALCWLLPAAMQAQKVSCKIKGSDTCLPLSQKFAEVYSKKFPGSNISVTGGGSGVWVWHP